VPDVVLIDAEEVGSLIETIGLFSNPANAAQINESMTQAERGEFAEVNYYVYKKVAAPDDCDHAGEEQMMCFHC